MCFQLERIQPEPEIHDFYADFLSCSNSMYFMVVIQL